jgi:hypothetical protein
MTALNEPECIITNCPLQRQTKRVSATSANKEKKYHIYTRTLQPRIIVGSGTERRDICVDGWKGLDLAARCCSGS